jgi:hypothetical protein
MAFSLHTAALAALHLFFSEKNPRGETILIVWRLLRDSRASLGPGAIWRRSFCQGAHAETGRKRRRKIVER